MFPLSRSVSHPLSVSGHHVRFVLHQAGYLVERDKRSFFVRDTYTAFIVERVFFSFFPSEFALFLNAAGDVADLFPHLSQWSP